MERVEGYYGTEAEFATKGIAPRRRPERGQVKSDERERSLAGPPIPRHSVASSRIATQHFVTSPTLFLR